MFGKLIENWKALRVLKAVQKEPIYQVAIQVIGDYLTDESQRLGKYASQKFKEELAEDILKEVGEVVLSENRLLANREKLATYTIAMAKYQVLILPAESDDEEEVTGLRGKPGVTGELKAHKRNC